MSEQRRQSIRRATIRDVAADAGVSKSLVSLVYSDPGAVSEARKARVLQAAARLGFRPNWVARSLAGERPDFVGILVADPYNPVLIEIVDAIRQELTAAGLVGLMTSAVVPSTDEEPRLDEHTVSLFGDLRPATVVIVGSVPGMPIVARDLAPARIIVASAVPDGVVPAATVRVDDDTGMRLVVQHLVELGHRDIAHIGGHGGLVAERRAAAYLAAMRDFGLGDRIQLSDSDYSEREGRRATIALLDGGREPTAIAAVNDLAAVGALAALTDRGAMRSVAVTGYDNTFLSGFAQIDLTSVDPDSVRVGAEIARLVLDPEASAGQELLVAPRLIIRGSSAARYGI